MFKRYFNEWLCNNAQLRASSFYRMFPIGSFNSLSILLDSPDF